VVMSRALPTITQNLADSLDVVVASARNIREQPGGMPQLVDRITLAEGTGLSWKEIDLAKLTAQSITETTFLDNPQHFVDTAITVTPTVIGIHTLVTDRVAARISTHTFSRMGQLAQNSIERKKDIDGLTVLDGATTSLGSSGSALQSGHIAAAKNRISSNTTEPGMPPYRTVLHGFQIKDIQDEVVAGVGTYPLESGLTVDVFRGGFQGMLFSTQIFENGNITITSNAAKGGVFAQESIVLVQGRSPRTETRREPHIGGGATSIFLYDEYAYGERSPGNWLFEIFTDATAPTS